MAKKKGNRVQCHLDGDHDLMILKIFAHCYPSESPVMHVMHDLKKTPS